MKRRRNARVDAASRRPQDGGGAILRRSKVRPRAANDARATAIDGRGGGKYSRASRRAREGARRREGEAMRAPRDRSRTTIDRGRRADDDRTR